MLKRYLAAIVVFLVGYISGLGTTFYSKVQKPEKEASLISARLREETGRYTNPLLMCDVDEEVTSEKYQSLETELEQAVSNAKKQGIDTASIYFRDFGDSSTLSINGEERFIPASLNKVPLMITAYSYAAKDPAFLSKKFVYQAMTDANAVQMIKPKETLKTFSQYSVEQALETMIVHSDNASYDALTKVVDYQDYLYNFRILKIPTDNEQGINAKEYSYFLRVLYNSTLLTREMSEKALELLTKSNYDKGIKAGVPSDLVVAHKFGISGGINAKGKPVDRQLHDCGIVYVPNNPYLLCVMTKSSDDLTVIENFIAGISKRVYEKVTGIL